MTFHWPYLLLALPLALAALLGLFALSRRARARLLAQFAAERLLPALLASYSPALRRVKQMLVCAGVLLVIFALARPQWGYDWEEKRARGVDVVFALDASKSMLAEDILPNRLERAKLAIMDLVEKMPGNRVGLVAFAGQAFLQCPLTLDYDAFRQSLEAVDTNVIAVGGSNLAAALAEGETALENSGNHKIIVFLTDGEDLAAEGVTAARAAEGRGVIVYTVGVGTPEGEIIPVRADDGRVEYVRDDQGQVVHTKLDAKTLASLAEVTNGFYVPLGATGEGLLQVYEAGIKPQTQNDVAARPQRRALERFQWPLALGLLLLALEPVIGTRRPGWRRAQLAARAAGPPPLPVAGRAALLAALLPAVLFTTGAVPRAEAADAPATVPAPAAAPPADTPAPGAAPAQQPARPATAQSAQRLFAQGDYQAAADAYAQAAGSAPQDARLRFNQGASLYRAGDYAAAADAFGQALETRDLGLQQRAYYNLGNTRFRAGQAELKEDPKKTVATWEAAVKDYEAALELNGGDADARYNLELVGKLLEQLKKQLEQQEKQQQQQQNQQNQNQQNQDQQSQNSDSQPQNSQDQQQNSQDQQNSQNQPQDGQSQPQNAQNQQGANQQNQSGQQTQSGQQNQPDSSSQSQQNQNGQQNSSGQPEQTPPNQSGQSASGQEQTPPAGAKNPSSGSQAQNQAQSGGEQPQNQPNQDRGPSPQNAPANRGNERGQQPEPQRGQNPADRGQQRNPSTAASDRGAQRGEQPSPADQRGSRAGQPDRGQAAQPGSERGQQAGTAAAAAGDKTDGQGEEGYIALPGVMTREEARQVLEALKVIEKKLPASNYDAAKEGATPSPAQPHKDW